MAEAPDPAFAVVEIFDDVELHLLNRHEYHLGDPLAWLDLVAFRAAIPTRDKYLALVIRVNEPGQVAEDQSVLVTQPGARQQHRSQTGIGNMNCQAGRYQHGIAGFHDQGFVNNGPHVEARRTVGGVVRQWDAVPDAWIEDLQVN